MGLRTPRVVGRRRLAAVTLALAAHLAFFALLLTGSGRLAFLPTSRQRATEVWLAPPTILRSQAAAPQAVQSQAPRALQPRSRAPAPSAGPPPSTFPAPPANGPDAGPAPGAGPGIAAALRRRVGCAEPQAAWMSDADRAACRERLAAGAEHAPHLEATSPVKLAYFNAVAKAQADWSSGRDAGHGLAIGCIKQIGPGVRTAPPHALRLGPCMIEPPRGSLNVDADILPDGETAKGPPAFLTTTHGPFSRPGL